jgi:para-nitrobenzyl esterase
MALMIAMPATPAMAAGSAPTVRIETGTLSGIHDAKTGLDEFLGIPFAAPPIGRLRWKPPRPVAAWKGIRKSDHFGPRCMQRGVFPVRSDGMSEDGLYLSVWAPAGSEGKKLPVLVYFHGGGADGDGSEPRYDGASLARRGIVTVTVNYRVNVFGFLALPALAKESPHHAAGNYGLLDQVAALRWVHRNIASFGGNPEEVTIGGESFGSMSVSMLMASPLSKGLVQRAIGESGASLGNLAPSPLALAEKRNETFESHVGAHSLAQLRAMPASKLLKATGDKGVAGFGPVIDGWFLPRPPKVIYEAGDQAHIPLLIGSNSQEGYYTALLKGQSPTPANYREAIGHAAAKQHLGKYVAEVLKLYPGRTEAEVKASGTALVGDGFIAFSTWRWMHLQRKTGAPVYYYYFTKGRPARRDGKAGPDVGARHSSEIEYALGNLSTNHVYAWTAADYKVSATMEGYFANFIKTGDPNGGGLPHWPAVAPKDGGLLRQVIGADTHTIVDHNAARYELLQRILNGAHH